MESEGSIPLLLVYLFLALGVSFLCSLLESVLMSTTLSYINLREEEGYKLAKVVDINTDSSRLHKNDTPKARNRYTNNKGTDPSDSIIL